MTTPETLANALPGPMTGPEADARLWRRLLRDRRVAAGSAVVLGFVLIALAAPVLAPHRPFAILEPLAEPSGTYPFGTDSLGHDVLSFMIWGSRVTLVFALGAAAVSFVVGVLVGGLPAYLGGRVDDLVSRFVELVLMIPQLFLIILVVAMLGSNQTVVMIVVGLTIWPANARLMRAQVLTLKERTFVSASVSAGHRRSFVLYRHVIPNGIGPVVAQSTLQMAHAVLIEAGLSFLGLGDPNNASWGQLLHDAQSNLSAGPWLAVAPGLGLLVLLLSLHLVGDGLQDVLNPRRAHD